MRLSKRSKSRRASAPLALTSASMIDVVFLLLIFFLVTTTFRTPTHSLVTPIIAKTNFQNEAVNNDTEQVTLAIRSQAGQIGYELGDLSTSDLSQLSELLKNVKPTSTQILVSVSDGIPFQTAVSVFDLCRSCGHETAAWLPKK